jgi:hypothetical protein
MKVRIMRGLPGSGKSYFGSKILQRIFKTDPVVCSADNFFIGEDGVYRFDVKKLAQAHESCRRAFLDALQTNSSEGGGPPQLVVVDNTNTTPTEIAFYYDLATLFTKDVEILTLEPPATMDQKDWLSQCGKMNQHGVPMKTITAMADRMKKKKFPWFWREKMVTREDGYFILNGKEHLV